MSENRRARHNVIMKQIRLIPLPAGRHPSNGLLEASVAIPGSKSYTNRALLMAAMTVGPVVISNPLMSDDTEAMVRCLETLGIRCEKRSDSIIVHGDISHVEDREYDLDADISGTTIRFILALACVVPGTKNIYGKEGLNKRPIKDLVDALRQLGAKIEYADTDGFPPLRVISSKLMPGTIRANGSISSQFMSALMMVAPLAGEITLEVEGEQISKPYVDMTIDTMQKFGIEIRNEGYKRYVIPGGQRYACPGYVVEGDVSSASYFAAIAALTGSTIVLTNMNPDSKQADMGFLKILEKMGSMITRGDGMITIEGHGVKALSIDMEDCPDQAQTLAVLAAFADGTTTITGVRSLRVKETERVKAVEAELAKMGIRTESTEDTLVVYGGAPKPAAIDTYGDHRMAMAFAVAGTRLAGMQINDPDVVSKTFPGFWDKLQSIGIGIEQV